MQARDGNLYGTTEQGGVYGYGTGYGTVFRIVIPPILVRASLLSGGNFGFSLQTAVDQSYTNTIQKNTNLATTNWVFCTNFTGDGSLFQFVTPVADDRQSFFRVREP